MDIMDTLGNTRANLEASSRRKKHPSPGSSLPCQGVHNFLFSRRDRFGTGRRVGNETMLYGHNGERLARRSIGYEKVINQPVYD